MKMELSVLEYVRVERVQVSADRHRLGFLLTGLPGVLMLCLPIGGHPSVAGGIVDLAQSVLAPSVLVRLVSVIVGSPELGVEIARAAMMVTPFSLLAWHLLRLRGGEPGRTVGTIGFELALVHACGLAVAMFMLAYREPWQVVVAGAALVSFGVLSALVFRTIGWGAFVLLALLCSYIAFWALVAVQTLMHLQTDRGRPWLWVIVAMLSAVTGGVEFVHVWKVAKSDSLPAAAET